MEVTQAVEAFGPLAQPTRLAVFRLLLEAGADGLPAGDIARRLEVPHNTLSTHLGLLARAGLAKSRRAGRSVIYSFDQDGLRALIAFILEDCCRSRPELCAPLLAAALPASCCPVPAPRRRN